jgi:putative ABC transport system permease protein
VPARIRSAHRERYLAVTGVNHGGRLQQVVDRDGHKARISPSGVTLSKALADILEVLPGDSITIEVLEGNRPVHREVVAHVVDDMLGLVVLMDMDRLHTLMDEGQVVTGAVLLVDSSQEATLARELKRIPHVLGSGFKRAFARTFRSTMAANMNLTMFVNLIFAVVIAFGVVYNAARVALSERSRDLASLRILGYTRGEVSMILAGELAILTMVAVPIGWMFGYVLVAAIMQTVQSEVYRIPFDVSHKAMAQASLGILTATCASGFSVIRRLDRLDLIAVLKVHE